MTTAITVDVPQFATLRLFFRSTHTMRKIIFIIAVVLSLASCKKVPIRQDLVVKLKSIDGTAFNAELESYQIQSGQTKVFKFEYSGSSPLKEYKIGTDYTQDQTSYLITKPEIGSTSGTFEFSMDVDALVNGIEVNNSSSQVFKLDMIDEDGSVGHFHITIQKQT